MSYSLKVNYVAAKANFQSSFLVIFSILLFVVVLISAGTNI